MINTYYIVGYTIQEPFVSPKLLVRIKQKTLNYDSIAKHIKLIMVNKEGNIITKHFSFFKLDTGELFNSFRKSSNYFKLSRAILGTRDRVTAYFLKLVASDFVGSYVSYNTINKKWVKAPNKLKFEPFVSSDNLFTVISGSYQYKLLENLRIIYD